METDHQDTSRQDPERLAALAAAFAGGDTAAGMQLVDAFVPLIRHMLRQDRRELPRLEREELEAEGTTVLLEYLHAGGDPTPARVAAVLRGRLRAHHERAVRLTEGEELLVRIATAARTELEVSGEPMSLLRTRVEQRCRQWALERCGGDEEAAAAKLSQRGITRALRDLEGLLAAADVVHLDAPLPSGDGTVADEVADRAAGPHWSAEVVGPLLAGLGDAERRAVLWAAGLEGDPSVGRTEIERSCGLPARSVSKLLDLLAWRAASPHLSWALFDPSVPAAVEVHDATGDVDQVLALASSHR